MLEDLIAARWASEWFQLDEEPLDDDYQPQSWPEHVDSLDCGCWECFTLGPLYLDR